MKPSNGFDFELPVLMTDPAVAYLPGEGYGPFDRGTQTDVWLKAANNSSPFLGAVWPGVTVFPESGQIGVQISGSLVRGARRFSCLLPACARFIGWFYFSRLRFVWADRSR